MQGSKLRTLQMVFVTCTTISVNFSQALLSFNFLGEFRTLSFISIDIVKLATKVIHPIFNSNF